MRKNTADFLEILILEALGRVRSGYYWTDFSGATKRTSLKDSIAKCSDAPIIAEIKQMSPSFGSLRCITDTGEVAKSMEAGGAVGISVLTEPKHFGGSLARLAEVKRAVSLPVLMKDIIVDPIQIEAATKLGADALLLIHSVFSRGMLHHTLDGMIKRAHSVGLEVLLETHTADEFRAALNTDADLVGVNNRDLTTLEVNLEITRRVLGTTDFGDRIVVSESGIHNPADIRFLGECGARAYLVGSAIMRAENIEKKVRELVMAYRK
ncbi:indole-3-glycerol-phosphate synthase [Candidatus Hadarchaeum sp.]|uniref:indole-3-glycerol-phosphate synthase n=1 Tax=Candidatus Hadarchaeum sp. TaxID=2883567 RepID=UPI003D0E6501